LDLKSRLVFIDTSAYEEKNYQFGEHALGKLQELVEDEKLLLLITDVTKSEIKSHLRKLAQESASKIKKIQKEAKFLRNTPDLSCHGIFTKLSADEVFAIVDEKFIDLIEGGNAEEVSVSTVDPRIVFDKYFAREAPFNKDSKKHEFPDAFALEAIKQIAEQRCHSIYIVSNDGDMKSYAESTDNLLYLNSVDEIIDLVLRNDAELSEPVNFADSVFESIKDNLIIQAEDDLRDSEFYSDEINCWDDEIDSIEVNSIEIIHKSLLNVTNEEAKYELVFECSIDAHYSLSDYDRSPWDGEDKAYVFVLQNIVTRSHTEKYSAYVTISYADGLKVNGDIDELEFVDSRFELNEENSEIIDFKELDINGE
jgi:hypothetical protein